MLVGSASLLLCLFEEIAGARSLPFLPRCIVWLTSPSVWVPEPFTEQQRKRRERFRREGGGGGRDGEVRETQRRSGNSFLVTSQSARDTRLVVSSFSSFPSAVFALCEMEVA